MRTIDAIAEILKREGINILPSFPTTPVIEAAAAAGIKPVICRQERVGVGIADGWTRVKNGNPAGAFAMQYGPGAENAFAGVSTAFSDAVPMLLLPLGHPLERDRVFPNFSSIRTYESVTKFAEQINQPKRVGDTLRRAFTQMRSGRPGPALVEVPVDVVEDHGLLRGEVGEERARGDVGGLCDVGDRRRVIAALGEEAHGRLDDLLARALLLAFSQSLWHVPIVANLHDV